MTTYYIRCLAVLLLSICFITCTDDKDDHAITPTEKLTKALYQKYPKATDIEWRVAGEYYVAEFQLDGTYYKVWFNEDALWYMTSYPISYAEVPQVVANALSTSPYGSWVITGVDLVEEVDILYYRFHMYDSGQTNYINITGNGAVI